MAQKVSSSEKTLEVKGSAAAIPDTVTSATHVSNDPTEKQASQPRPPLDMSRREDLMFAFKYRANELLSKGDEKLAAVSLLSDFTKVGIYPAGHCNLKRLIRASIGLIKVDAAFINSFE